MISTTPGGDAGAPARSNLALRIISAAALAPLALGAAWLGGSFFFAFWLIAGLGVMWEWVGLVERGPSATRTTAAGMAALVAAALALALGYFGGTLLALMAGVLVVAWLAPRDRWLIAGAGVLYAAAVGIAPPLLRGDLAYGFAAIMLLFAVVWTTDIAAYFGGRAIGGPKLWPAVSPKKTWSGALVGTVGAAMAGMGVGYLAAVPNLAGLGAVCVALSAVSQLGDLFESAIKRRFGVKDSSQLIPGHGGLMDRLDGFVAAALAAALIGLCRGGLDAPSRGLMIW